MKFEDNVFHFLKELKCFTYDLDYLDHKWNIIFPELNGAWNHLHVTKYKETFYIIHIDGNLGSLEVVPKKSVRVEEPFGFSSYGFGNHKSTTWESLISSARRWLKITGKDWIKANRQVVEKYPLNHRFGIVPNSLIIASLPDFFRIDRELGKIRTRKLLRLLETRFFDNSENTEISSMTVAKYFEYCKIAYIAGRRKGEKIDGSMTGREMYSRFADGRHDGLLDIDETSEQEFADWIDGKHQKKGGGGHPWEIKRGGNTTHIDLFVRRPRFAQDSFIVELRGESFVRLTETLKMLLAIVEAKLPISITNPEDVRKRILALDNIGIVPAYAPLHRANQRFKREDDVFDVMYYDDLGRYKRRITPFITWEPLPILKPRNI